MGRLVEIKKSASVELTSVSESAIKNYADRTSKYIPSEIVAAYVSLNSIVKSADTTDIFRIPASWVIFIACLVATPAYLNLFNDGEKSNRSHLIISTIAFGIWGYALGGPFELANIYRPWIGSVLLGLFTLLAGLIEPIEN